MIRLCKHGVIFVCLVLMLSGCGDSSGTEGAKTTTDVNAVSGTVVAANDAKESVGIIAEDKPSSAPTRLIESGSNIIPELITSIPDPITINNTYPSTPIIIADNLPVADNKITKNTDFTTMIHSNHNAVTAPIYTGTPIVDDNSTSVDNKPESVAKEMGREVIAAPAESNIDTIDSGRESTVSVPPTDKPAAHNNKPANIIKGWALVQAIDTATTNNRPRARYAAATWVDSSGNLYLFGGYGENSNGIYFFNDLWKYDLKKNEWIEVGSTNTSQAKATKIIPAARGDAATWVDSSGNFWLFGGYGENSSGIYFFNDLWKYDLKKNEWLMVGDPIPLGNMSAVHTNTAIKIPTARKGAATWVDSSGNLYLFGGSVFRNVRNESNESDEGIETKYFNDFWKYDIKNNKWVEIYAPLSLATPGARHNAAAWVDLSGNLYLFGGYGVSMVVKGGGYLSLDDPTEYMLNDLWRYDIKNNQWDRISEGTQHNNNINVPGVRYSASSWTDSSGNFWLFGGIGINELGGWGYRNDLWRYDVKKNEWVMMGGVDIVVTKPTDAIDTTGSTPSARNGMATWFDKSSNTAWIFGGSKMGASAFEDEVLNDLWKYVVGV